MSLYPDNSRPYVLPPLLETPNRPQGPRIFRADNQNIRSKLSFAIARHRRVQIEEYLVKWRTSTTNCITPYSWHNLDELSDNLFRIQKYLDAFYETFCRGIKRKTPDLDPLSSRSSDRSSSTSTRSSTFSPTPQSGDFGNHYVYNGQLSVEGLRISMVPISHDSLIEDLPTPLMLYHARLQLSRGAEQRIWQQFKTELKKVPGPPVEVVNGLDYSSPPLNFKFIDKSVTVGAVTSIGPDGMVGCGGKGGCKPHMGQHIGCEYGKLCSCLEFAAIDEARMSADDWQRHEAGELMGLPKRFPYHNPTSTYAQAGCLVNFYLESRNAIYECNRHCDCGLACKTRIVQKGRKVPLVIFKTRERGWGLRATVDLQKGQFIDTYRGEIITGEEADRREASAGDSRGKQSYLYTLDKHIGDVNGDGNQLTEDDCFVVDGEYKGGPTRFMNHSCDPNCRQYTVQYNKYDIKLYELAFFAYKFIPAGTELTFNYKDYDEDEDEDDMTEFNEPEDEEGEYMKCRCGSANCKGRLWI